MIKSHKIVVKQHPDVRRAKRWMVCFRNAEGKRCATYFATKAEAETSADAKKTELLNFGLRALSLSDDARREAQKATELLQPHGKSILDAAKFFATYLERRNTSCTIEELLPKFLAEKEANNLSRRHLGDLRVRLTRFAGDFKGKVVSTFEPEEITLWLRSLSLSPQSQQNFRSTVRNLFSYAKRLKLIENNPVADTPTIRIPDRKVTIYNPEEIRLLLDNADPAAVPFLALGAFAGLRSAEICRLQWSDIQPNGYIRLDGEITKTSRKRHIQMTANLEEWLRPWRAAPGKIVPDSMKWRLWDLLKAASEKSGVLWKRNALRHSFGSYRLASTGDVNRTALEMGNSPGVLQKHYEELVTPEQAAAYWSIKPNPPAPNVIPMSAAA